MKKTLALLCTLSTSTILPFFTDSVTAEKAADNPVQQNIMHYLLEHYSFEKEAGWIRLLEHLVKNNQSDAIKKLQALIIKKQTEAFGGNQELLWRRFKVLVEMILQKQNPRLMLDVMPTPNPSIIRPLLACAGLSGFAYYLYTAYASKPIEAAAPTQPNTVR